MTSIYMQHSQVKVEVVVISEIPAFHPRQHKANPRRLFIREVGTVEWNDGIGWQQS